MQHIANTIEKIKKFHGISTVNETIDFIKYEDLKSSPYGVYILFHDNEILYVGQGHVKVRAKRHMEKLTVKALEDLEPGWLHLRTKRTLDFKKFKLIVMRIEKQVDVNCMEADLIKHLLPFVNSQVFGDLRHMGLLKTDI